jgi:hypothetical protein
MPTEKFKSREAYRKNLAYRHIHGIPMTAKKVVVGGKAHAVKHSSNPARKRIDTAQKKKVAKRGQTSVRRGNQFFESESHAYHY